MCKFVVALAVMLFAVLARSQVVSVIPSTEIENFDAQTNTIMVKGYQAIGSVTVNSGKIVIRCKESVDVTHGRKEYGMTVAFDGGSNVRDYAVVDEDELGSLLDGFDYLTKISATASNLAAFDAETTTKSALCIEAHSSQRQGAIFYFLMFGNATQVPLTMDQLVQLQNLVSQVRTDINNLQQAK